MASGPFELSLPSWLKTLVTPLFIAMQNKKRKNEDILTFLNVLGDYFFSYEKVDMYSKKRTYGSPN